MSRVSSTECRKRYRERAEEGHNYTVPDKNMFNRHLKLNRETLIVPVYVSSTVRSTAR